MKEKNYNEKYKTKLALYLQFLLKVQICYVNNMMIAENGKFKDMQLVLNKLLANLYQLDLIEPWIVEKYHYVEEIIKIQDTFNKEADLILKKSKKYEGAFKAIKGLLENISDLGMYNTFNGVDAKCLGYYSEKNLFKKLNKMSKKPNFDPETQIVVEKSTGAAFVINNYPNLIKEDNDEGFRKFMAEYLREDKHEA